MPDEFSAFREMSEEGSAMFMTFTVVVSLLTRENPGARERLIDNLNQFLAKAPEGSRSDLHFQQLAAFVLALEGTQFQ